MSNPEGNEVIEAAEPEILSEDECLALDILECMGPDAAIQDIYAEINRRVKDEVRRFAILSKVGLERQRRRQQVLDVEFGNVPNPKEI